MSGVLSPLDRANAAQRAASDPTVSAFVSASAGSGKTKLLTDRLLRLMLGGADPARIQCLTFTKAAAAEMALRLQRRLGQWVTMADAALDAELAGIGVEPSDAVRSRARALFATVLDLPGGMRIGTIHAFCQSLLRRFPLEARLSPHFVLADDRDTALAWQEARETMLRRADAAGDALETVAPWSSLDGFGRLVQGLQARPEALAALGRLSPEDLLVAMRRTLGARDFDPVAAMSGMDEATLRRIATPLLTHKSKTYSMTGQVVCDTLALAPADRVICWEEWCKTFLKKDDEPKLTSFRHHSKAGQDPAMEDAVTAEAARLLAIIDGRKAAELAHVATAFLLLARPVLSAYEDGKSRTARLDYADLIARTAELLRDPGAAWVLFKLDGGLDHLLLDEVQDTSPEQWDIAGQLTREFFAGEGARGETARTVFAVGDQKQSIYGFQGADPKAFEHWRDRLGAEVRQGGQSWRDVPLDVSFRSTAPVLALVDSVFDDAGAAPGVAHQGTLTHVVKRTGEAGRIELWPRLATPEPEALDAWATPEANRTSRQPRQRLAEALAASIRQWLDEGRMLPSKGRPLTPGDILVLVRKRDAFGRAFVTALKTRGVAVAGLDRMTLTAEPAIVDMLTLCDALLLPQDDLALACVLTSPLGGLSDEQLMRLALGRKSGLFQALKDSQEPECQTAAAFLEALYARVDHTPPHALLAEALGRLGGRARLLARFGQEAGEPLDELLAAALRHAETHPPSLQGFLQWVRQSAASVKREAEAGHAEALDAVRIMTVHGAKGLQAPLVILPDTTGTPPREQGLAWLTDPQTGLDLPVWCPAARLSCAALRSYRADQDQLLAQERNRLLYVALTRAEDWLLVCGFAPKKEPPESWYNQIARGFERLGVEEQPAAFGLADYPGTIRAWETAQTAPVPAASGRTEIASVSLPSWAGSAPLWQPAALPAEPVLPQPLAPSRPENAQLGAVPEADSPLLARDTKGARFRRGQVVHALLQHLPALPVSAREDAARRFIAASLPDLPDADELLGEVMAVLDHPELTALFGPTSRAEVPLSGVVRGASGPQVIGGLVDRLAFPAHPGGDVLIADYKTNRNPPASVQQTPVLYLRQLAAYRAVLRDIFPQSRILCALVWTVGAKVQIIPPELLDGHAPDASSLA